MKKIQVLKPKFRVDECLNEIKECLEIGWTGMGFKTIEFENQWKEYTSLPYAHFLNSATSGLHLAVSVFKKTLNWSDQDEIITSPFTFVSTNHAIIYEKLKPQFADIDSSLNLDPESVKKNINHNTRAIVFVGIGGNTKNLREIIKIAKENNLILILDAAHMAGSRIDGQHVGFDVDASIFSFQAVKNLPTADSGMICFRDAENDRLARELSWLGINKDTFDRSNSGTYKWDYRVNHVGYKYHGNSIMAALGIVGLRYLDEDNKTRRKLAERYYDNLGDHIECIVHESDETARHIFQVVVRNRQNVIDALARNGIYPGVHYRANTEYAIYENSTFLERADYYSKNVLSLPLHLDIELDDVDRISDIVKKVASDE